MIVKMGMYVQAFSGKGTNVVFSDTEFGTVGREYVIPANPSTPPQEASRSYFKRATQAFEVLPKAKVDAWNEYASQFKTRNKQGKLREKRGLNVFTALAAKFLQVTPAGTIPQDPPTSDFTGDNPVITVTAGTGKLTFSSTLPNSSGVVTELLFQRLVNGNRKPGKEYKTGAYFAFAPGSLSRDVTVPPGFYAAGYRFVRTATGQQSKIRTLPVTQVNLAVAKKAA
ncbi:MAG: hypothetical protein KF884_07320 [Fimbriimonadaceae bacterium]|nr:hypothetical protein [Fimbriimonadaceae bacterium]QYK57359.1 MAG: hypothetical protein KF884_07320 [Fimbriimonadaceae bacterium]